MKNTVVKTNILSTDITAFGAEWWRPTSIDQITEDLHTNINKQLNHGWVLQISGHIRVRELIAELVPTNARTTSGIKVVEIDSNKDMAIDISLRAAGDTRGYGNLGVMIIDNDITKVDKAIKCLMSIFKKYEIDAKYLHYPEPIIIERKFISQLSLNLYVMI